MTAKIVSYQPEQNPFNIIYVDITHRCQMQCANCYLPNRDFPDMENEPLFNLLEKLPRKVDIRLIGGEPTLRKDIDLIIQRIKSLNHRPMLITNGLKLADLDYCIRLKECGLEYAQISLNGFNDDKIYRIIDQMDCAQLKMNAIENCEKAGIGVSISSIIIKDLNDHLIDQILNFSKTLKKPVRVNFRNVGSLGRNMSSSVTNLTFDDMINLVAKSISISPSEIKKHMTSKNQLRYPFKVGPKRSEVIWIKITDWRNYPVGANNSTEILENAVKGRVTQDFLLAPFFEHVKENEFGY